MTAAGTPTPAASSNQTPTTPGGGNPMGLLSMFAGGDITAAIPSLHERGPVIASPFASIVVGHDAASAVLKDAERFSSDASGRRGGISGRLAAMGGGAASGLLAAMGGAGTGAAGASPDSVLGRSMLSSDPPDHTRLRSVVAKAFTPRSVAALERRVREIADDLLAPLADGEPYELISRLAGPLPVIVIAELLGIPIEDHELFRKWSDDLLIFNDPAAARDGLSRVQDSVRDLSSYFLDVIEQRRREPRDDLVSRLVEANEGGILSHDELVRQCILLLVAGNETTTHLIGNAVHSLWQHPEQRQRLLDDPSLTANAVEETLRFNGVVIGTARGARGAVDVAGTTIPDGSMVFVFIAAANRDPAQFDNPRTFDVARPNASHNLGFGGGIHYCLGAALARQETRVALETLHRVAPQWRLADPDAPVDYTLFLRGPKRLELVA